MEIDIWQSNRDIWNLWEPGQWNRFDIRNEEMPSSSEEQFEQQGWMTSLKNEENSRLRVGSWETVAWNESVNKAISRWENKAGENLSISFRATDAFLFLFSSVLSYRLGAQWKVGKILEEEALGYCLGLMSPHWLYLYSGKPPGSVIYQVLIKWRHPKAAFISNIFWKIILFQQLSFKMLDFFLSLNFLPPLIS